MADLHRLLAPRSIAVAGGAPAERVVQQCLKLGFPGPIWPVHPKRADLAGVPCVPSLDDLPDVPDAVFLGVNRHATIEAMAVLRSMGAGGAVCYGSGFAETGDDDLQTDLLDSAGDVPFLGPNCYGIVNTFDRVALWPDEHVGADATGKLVDGEAAGGNGLAFAFRIHRVWTQCPLNWPQQSPTTALSHGSPFHPRCVNGARESTSRSAARRASP